MADVDPWDRQDGESAVAYEAFRVYRDAPPDERSIAQVVRQVGKARSLITGWSSRNAWVVRSAAWDREQERLWRTQVARRRREMALRHAKIAGAMQGKLVERLQKVDPAELSVGELARWLQVAADVERRALGEPDRVEVAGPGGGPVQTADLTAMSPEEQAARLDQLRREIERRIGQQ
jgi:hypothetical protein